jgi:hypothetical protein
MNVSPIVLPTPDFAAHMFRAGQRPASEAALAWLWHGMLAAGRITTLISQSKSGKTTLLSLLLARLQHGGQLGGLAVAPGRAFVVSEEPAGDWDLRIERLGIGPNVRFLCRPFKGASPTLALWNALVDYVAEEHRKEPLDLVVIDPLATLLPGNAELSAPQMRDCLLPFQALAGSGPAVLLIHHTGKDSRIDGLASRGSSALPGFVEIEIEMFHVKRPRSKDRRRRLCGYSHYVETPKHLILELNTEGTDYVVRTDAQGARLVGMWPAIEIVLQNTINRLTVDEILRDWPYADREPPSKKTLGRWLKRAVKQELVCRDGTGFRGSPHRYWLPGREPLLWPGNDASDAEKDAFRERLRVHRQALKEQGKPDGNASPAGGIWL